MSPAKLLAIILLASLANAAPAQTPAAATGGYRVEVIIVRALNPPGGEDLGAVAEARGFNGRLQASSTPPRVLRLLDASALQMNDVAARLRAGSKWEVLAHAGWVQTATTWPRHDGIALADAGISVPELSGSFYVESGQLLHFGMNLKLGLASPWSLAELRAIKFNEKHYYDHPGFGVIALVSRSTR